MRRRSHAPLLFLAGWTAFVAPSLLAEDPAREEIAFDATVDPRARVETGGALAGGGPVRLRLRDIPVGDPDAGAASPRSHLQGERAGDIQRGITPRRPAEEDPSAVFGPPPGPAPDLGSTPKAPSGVGSVLRSFEGQVMSSWIPPDPVLAVGPKYILEVVNSGFTIFSKDGDVDREYTDLENFFSPLYPFLPEPWSGNSFAFDPRAIFTPEHDRYVLFALGRDDNNLRSYLFVAISETDDPFDGWDLYFYYDPFNLDTWVDYSGMSADEYGLYFTGNEYEFGDGFRHAILVSVRPTIFSGGSTAGWIFTDLRWNDVGSPKARTLQPAVPNTTPLNDETFFVNTYITSGNQVSLWELTGDRGDSPTLVRNTIAVSSYADPGQAAQPFGADDIDMFNAGTLSAAYSVRKVYFSLNDDGNERSAFYTGRIDVDTLDQERNITYYSASDFYYYPAVGLFGVNNTEPLVAVAMSYSSNDTHPSGVAKIFESFMTDSSGYFNFTADGLSSYHNYDNQGRNRWGDYLAVARDWSCNTMWFLTQYTPSLDDWSTRLTHIEGDAVLPGVCRLIFDDGFERGDTDNW